MSSLARRFQKCFALALLLGLSLPASAQNAEEILMRYLKTVSNDTIDKWKLIRSAYMERIGDFRNPDQVSQPNFSAKKPNLSRFYWVYPDKTKEEFLDESGSVVTTSFFNVNGKYFLVMANMEPHRLEPSSNFEFQPVQVKNLMDKARHIIYSGIRKFPTGDCHHIEIVTKEQTHRLYINVGNFFLDYWAITPPDANETLTRFDNYKQIDGLWFSMSQSTTRGGGVFHWSTLQKIELNPEIPDSVFDYEGR